MVFDGWVVGGCGCGVVVSIMFPVLIRGGNGKEKDGGIWSCLFCKYVK